MSIAVPLLYGNLHGGYDLTDKDWGSRVADQVQLVLDSGCWIFLAVELHEEKGKGFGSSPSGLQYFLRLLRDQDLDWALLEGDGGNHCLYRPSKVSVANPGARTSWKYAVGARNYSDFVLRENTTSFVAHYLLTHLIANDSKDKKGRRKSRQSERNAQGRAFARFAKTKGYAVAAGDFNSSSEASGFPRHSMKQAGFQGLRERGGGNVWNNMAGNVANGGQSTVNSDQTQKYKSTYWIDEIWTRPAQPITAAALVDTSSASDHNWLKVTVTWDANVPEAPTPPSAVFVRPQPYTGNPWTATVRDRDFVAVDPVRFISGTLVETYEQPDMLSLTGTWAGMDAALEPGQGILLYDDRGRQRFSGHLVDIDILGTRRCTLIYASDTVRLWWRICWPNPAGAWSRVGQNRAYDIVTGPAETRLLSYVNRNLGPGARDERTDGLLRLPATQARGFNGSTSARFDVLGEVAGKLAELANVRMRIVQTYTGLTPHLDLTLEPVFDLSDQVTFATPEDGGTYLLSPDWHNRIALPTVTSALGAAGGLGADRLLALLEDQDAQELWGSDDRPTRIEQLVDLGDTTDTTEVSAGLTAALASGVGPTEISLPIGRAPGLGYEIPTGSLVNAVARGVLYSDRIRQITTELSKQTSQPTVKTTGVIGSPDGGIKTPTQRRLAQALADAKRGQAR